MMPWQRPGGGASHRTRSDCGDWGVQWTEVGAADGGPSFVVDDTGVDGGPAPTELIARTDTSYVV